MQIAVIGVGLIGGSIALAARERLGCEVTGYDTCEDSLQRALQMGALDRKADSIAGAVCGAEIVFAAVPVGALPAAVGTVLEHSEPDCVVSDVGSTKRAVVAAHPDPRFVGGHPLAGVESAGVEHARGELFDGATWYLTPTATTSGVLYERLHRFLHGLGARPGAIDPETHDAILASVSHVPHVLANVLVSQAAGVLHERGEQLPATGPSFRDATRVAGAPGAIWNDIYLSNRDAICDELERAQARLSEVVRALRDGDREWISTWNEDAAQDRRRLLESQLGEGPLHQLRVTVPNRPGVVAQLALELGRAGVNITDMGLYPAPDMSEGVVALWIAGDRACAQAQALLEQLGMPVVRT